MASHVGHIVRALRSKSLAWRMHILANARALADFVSRVLYPWLAFGEATVKRRVRDGTKPPVGFIVPSVQKLDVVIAQLDQRVDPLLPAVDSIAEGPELALCVTGDDEAT